MHEFGHQLSLGHGSDGIIQKPNYLSILSYSYQINSRWPRCPVDYSNEKIRSINESVLNESRGLNASRNWPIFQNSSDDDRDTWTDGTPIDWNGDEEIDEGTVTQDIESFNRSKESSFEVLECYDDWANLNLIPANCPVDGGGVTIPVDEMADEQTYEEAHQAAAESDFDGDGVSSLEDNCPQIPNPGQADDGVGDACDRPRWNKSNFTHSARPTTGSGTPATPATSTSSSTSKFPEPTTVAPSGTRPR